MKNKSIQVFAICLALVALANGAQAQQWAKDSKVLRLLDRLDRPQDGYCVDVVGVGLASRTDLPLIAHNCSSQRSPDEAVRIDNSGLIRFPAFKLCVTAMGINGLALPGSAILLRRCGELSSFMDASDLQEFSQHPDGRLTLGTTNLCLTVGSNSARTYSTQHRWRALYLEDCATTPPERSRWEFTTIKAKQ